MEPDAFDAPSREAATAELRRIVGLETEHAVLFLPDPGETGAAPPFDVIQEALFECLLAERRAVPSGGLKGGYFLENGGLVHLEVYLREQADTPILEASTPECRSPWDVLAYSRAFDEILEETSRRSRDALRTRGYRGRIVFGKNNVDVHSTGFGCHENYLVHSATPRAVRTLFFLSLPLFLVALMPAAVVVGVILTFLLVFGSLGVLLRLVAPSLAGWTWDALREVGRGILERFGAPLRAVYCLATNFILLPAIGMYSFFLRCFALRPFLRDLPSFLASRAVLCGSGRVNFRAGTFELSQRAELTRSVAEIILFGRRKTFFDLKGFLYDPLEFFRSQKKLTILVGDSNLADVSNLLKLGTTVLLLEMIEAGESFADLRLRNPVRSLQQLSCEGPWKEIRLRRGGSITGIELQKEFLRRARAFHSRQHRDKLRREEILRLWEENLEQLAERPQRLSDRLDWPAKKALIDREVLAQTSWKPFLAWGAIFHRAGLAAVSASDDFPSLVRRAVWWKRRGLRTRLRAAGLDASECHQFRQLYFTVQKLDFRYHEIGGGSGYQRILEADGHITRLASEAEIESAKSNAPADTRAHVRGYYVRNAQSRKVRRINWNEIEFLGPAQPIRTPDPFAFRLPSF